MTDRAWCEEYESLLLGDLLGEGVDRSVYECRIGTNFVVKVQTGRNCHQNFLEWEVYHALRHSKHEKWLAPCEYISDKGTLLIQARTEPVPKDLLPKTMPEFLHYDLRQDNVGWYDGRVVVHDYGYLWGNLRNTSIRKKKVDWSRDI